MSRISLMTAVALGVALSAVAPAAFAQSSRLPSQYAAPIPTEGLKGKASGSKQAQPEQKPGVQVKRVSAYDWVVGIAAGRIEGAPLRLAAEIAQVGDDGDNLRIMPIVTRGVFDNISDILYLRGVDAAIVYGDVLEHYRATKSIPNVERRVAYLANLSLAEVHVLARPGINSLKDLAGKRVNFNTAGTAAAFTGPIVFEKLGIKVVQQFEPHREVMAAMATSEDVAAVVFVTTKPVPPIAQPKWPDGFKLIPVEYTAALEEFYLPANLEHAEYPKLIPVGQKVATIAVPVILAVFNAPPDTDRYRRLSRFTDRFVERLPQLQKPPYDPSWRDINLAAIVPGWKRFAPMQARLDRIGSAKPRGVGVVTGAPAPANSTPTIDEKLARQQAARAAPTDPAEQDRLFKTFLEWNRLQKK
jgi:TRAP-type uncharacterized transport system substrate-binding protein